MSKDRLRALIAKWKSEGFDSAQYAAELEGVLADPPQTLCQCGHSLDAHVTGGCAMTLPSTVEEWTGRSILNMCECKGFQLAAPTPADGPPQEQEP